MPRSRPTRHRTPISSSTSRSARLELGFSVLRACPWGTTSRRTRAGGPGRPRALRTVAPHDPAGGPHALGRFAGLAPLTAPPRPTRAPSRPSASGARASTAAARSIPASMPGRERRVAGPMPRGPRPEPGLGDDRVVVLAEHDLQSGRGLGERSRRLAHQRRHRIGRVATRFARIRIVCSSTSRRVLSRPTAPPSQVPPGPREQLRHDVPGRHVGVRRGPRGSCAPSTSRSSERDVAIAPERLDQQLVRLLPPLHQRLDHLGEPRLLGRRDRPGPTPDTLEEHVGVARLAEHVAQPPELLAERQRPRRIEPGAERPQIGTEPTGRNPRLVHALRVGVEPHHGVVAHQMEDRRGQRPARAPRSTVAPRRERSTTTSGGSVASDPTARTYFEVGSAAPAPADAEPTEHLFEHPVGRVVGDLDLELPEPRRDPAPGQHRDLVVHDVAERAGRRSRAAASSGGWSEGGPRPERRGPHVDADRVDRLVGRRRSRRPPGTSNSSRTSRSRRPPVGASRSSPGPRGDGGSPPIAPSGGRSVSK